jgi:site-specific DNA recombinase
MSVAILYIRVSTDEQAVKGYSQRSQAERLVKYCSLHNIEVFDTIFEDFSAKTFNRPQWMKFFETLKTENTKINLVLFTSWDRFSRNIADAYSMIQKLKRLGIDPQAIDQPIDLEIPESKIMLAMYLATSEVENDRKSKSIRLGIHKAKQEGKWMGKAPLGYQNRQSAAGRKYIELKEPEASLLRTAFEMIARDEYSINYIYKMIVSAGLKCSRSNFSTLIKNPVYCGHIIIPEFEIEKRYVLDGIHERLISILLFEKVQEVLNRRRKKAPKKYVLSEHLILRGILLCPNCGKTLTGSGSMGRYNKYYYYHCSSGCKFRTRADRVNEQFIFFLKKLNAQEPYVELSEMILKDISREGHEKNSADQSQLTLRVEKLLDRIINARDLFSKGDIDYDDYMTIRLHCQDHIKTGIKELQQLAVNSVIPISTLNRNYPLNEIYEFYKDADILSKRQFIGLVFPEKVLLDDFEAMVIRPMKIIFNLKDNVTSPIQENYFEEATKIAEEKYLKVIAKAIVKNEIITLEIASQIIFFLKRVIFTLFKGKIKN